MKKKENIFLVGPMGAGKTTVGLYLSRELKMEFYDLDAEVEKDTGVNIPWIFDVEGEEGFRRREQDVMDKLTSKQGIVLATGGGAVLSPKNRVRLCSRGTVIYLKIPVKDQVRRVKNVRHRPLLIENDLMETLKSLNEIREPLYREIADLSIDTNNLSQQAVLSRIMMLIGK